MPIRDGEIISSFGPIKSSSTSRISDDEGEPSAPKSLSKRRSKRQKLQSQESAHDQQSNNSKNTYIYNSSQVIDSPKHKPKNKQLNSVYSASSDSTKKQRIPKRNIAINQNNSNSNHRDKGGKEELESTSSESKNCPDFGVVGVKSSPSKQKHCKSSPNNIQNTDRQSTFTSNNTSVNGSKTIDRTGTFVRNDDTDDENTVLSKGLKIPRIDSASMSTKEEHIIRKASDNRVREANVIVVEGDMDEKSHAEKADTNTNESSNHKEEIEILDDSNINSEQNPDESPPHNNSTANNMDEVESSGKTSESTQETENSGNDTKRIRKSLDINTPFQLSKQQPEIREPSQQDPKESNSLPQSPNKELTAVDRSKNHSPAKSPLPAEPVLHKKSNYTSQQRKKGEQEEEMEIEEEQEKSSQDDRIVTLTAMLNEMSQKLAEADEENRRLRQDNVDLRTELTQMNDSKEKTDSEIGLLKSDWQELAKQLESLTAENQELKQQLELQGDSENSRVKEVTQQRAELEAEVIQLKTDMKDLLFARDKEIKSHEITVNDMKKDFSEKETEWNKLKLELENQIQEFKDLIEKLKKEIIELQTANEKLSSENSSLSDRVKELELELSLLKGQNKTFSDQAENYQLKIKMLEENQEKLTTLEAQVQKTENQLQDSLKENETLKNCLNEKEEVINRMKDSMNSLKDLDHSFESLQQENNKYAKQINNLTEENTSLKNQLRPKEEEMNKLLQKITELSEKIETGKVALSSMTELVKEKQAHIDTLKKEVKTLSETNNNYLITMETFSNSKKQSDDVVKSKYNDMESAHKKILEENKRLRTTLAHKNMAQTSVESETEDLRKALEAKEQELERSKERVAHLEAMLDDVYKTNEIKLMQNSGNHSDYINEEEAGMSVTSLPDIRNSEIGYASSRGSYAQNYIAGATGNRTQDSNKWASTYGSSMSLATDRSTDLRNYRDAAGYAKRFENRPRKKGAGGGGGLVNRSWKR